LKWCRDINIKEVSVFAFSINNFKRDIDEVTYLMNMVREKFQRLIDEIHLLKKYDVCDIAKNIIKVTLAHQIFYLNICMTYTSHDVINQCMYMINSNKVDLMIRTSGEARLSDFLIWQTENSCVKLFDSYWPEFSIWNLFTAILKYQTSDLLDPKINQVHENASFISSFNHKEKRDRINNFLMRLECKFTDWLYNNNDVSNDSNENSNDPDVTENLDNIARKMGINQSNNNSRPTMKVKLNKSDRCSEEKLNEKDISKSFQVPNYDYCVSVDCILDYAKQKKLTKHRESNSSTSEDLIEQEAKLNAGMNPLSNYVISDEFPDLKNKKNLC